MIGGTFYEPATRYPEIFGHIQILRDRPYLLPCAVSSFVTLCAIVAGYFLIEEVSFLESSWLWFSTKRRLSRAKSRNKISLTVLNHDRTGPWPRR